MRIDHLLGEFARERVLAITIVLVVIAFAVMSPDFLTLANAENVGAQSSMILIVGIGMTLVIIGGQIDLSVGSLASLVGMATVWLLVNGSIPALICLALGLVVGLAVGLLQGCVVVVLNVPGIIVTLASLTALRGLCSLFANGAAIQSADATLAAVAWGRLASVPIPIVLVIIVAVCAHLFLTYSAPGRALYAIGGNSHAARLSGINVSGVIIMAYTLSGFTAAIAGLIAASRTAAGSPIVGVGWELKAVAVAILGGANLFGGSGGIVGTILAGILVAVIENGLSLLNVSSWAESCLVGGLLIAVVGMNALRREKGRGQLFHADERDVRTRSGT
jgi:ribose/xylose/arabinose/galactoside ABC-type transport system permease subunit